MLRRGFSMAELILCLGILATAIIFLTTFFISINRLSSKSDNTSIGAHAAETVLNQQLHDIFKGVHPALTKATFLNNNASPGISGSILLGVTQFQYQMDYATVQAGAGGDLGGSQNRLKLVTIHCWWWGANANAQRTGQGRLSVELRRLVNENDKF